MKELNVAQLIVVVQSLSMVRVNLMWAPATQHLSTPLTSSRLTALTDRIFDSGQEKRRQDSYDRGLKAMKEHTEAIVGNLSESLKNAEEQLALLDLKFSLAEVSRVRKKFEIGTMPTPDELNTIVMRIFDEVRDRRFLSVGSDYAKYYSVAHYSPEVSAKFPSVMSELEEAGKCLALELPTACVFHLMRTMEIAVRATAACLSVPNPVQGGDRNWGNMIGNIKTAMKAKWPNNAARFSGDGQFFESLVASLEAVKNPWRNATMHVENTYTMEEAQRIWSAVEGFMIVIASRFDEQGTPKA